MFKYTCLLIFFFLFSSFLHANGYVKKMKGNVFVNSKPASLKMSVKSGDFIKVEGEKSFVQIIFNDSSSFLLKEGELELKKIEKKNTLFNLIKGSIFNVVDENSRNGFRLITKHVSYGVRGTKFFIDSSKNYLCVCDGTVSVKNKSHKVDVRRGEDTSIPEQGKIYKTRASIDMWKMAQESFSEMGFPIKDLE